MQLYVTLSSPYARMARVLIIEKNFEERIAVTPVKTRAPGAPYYAINPSGRVPSLVTDKGELFEESALICAYLDALADPLVLAPATGWPARRREAQARSMLDGLAVWGRELSYRSTSEQSPTIVAHETARARRMAALFDTIAASGALDGPLDMAQLTLGCALHRRQDRFDWRPANANLAAWVDKFGERESMRRTLPPQ
jgi:glutathione S-transferase